MYLWVYTGTMKNQHVDLEDISAQYFRDEVKT